MAKLNIGDPMPSFPELPGADARSYSANSFQNVDVLVVGFFCNGCPYVRSLEDRLKQFALDNQDRAVRLLCVNSNDETEYPEDTYEHMVLRARDHEYPFAYLRDADQIVAESFGATHTPEFFIFDGDRRLRYHGLFDDSIDDADAVTRQYVRDSVEALLDGRPIETAETQPIGCTIKWCRENAQP